jgi:hypothetical protein
MMIIKYLVHDKLSIRLMSLLLSIAVLFVAVWILSYYFLPEGILRGRNIAQLASGEDLLGDSIWLEWFRLFTINLTAMLVFVCLPNLFVDNHGIPLGYATITIMACYFGILLGTNSFAIASGDKIAPTIGIFASSGFYEISAYILAAVSTVTVSKYRIIGHWPKQTMEKLGKVVDRRQMLERNIGLGMAILILFTACGWEAYTISQSLFS